MVESNRQPNKIVHIKPKVEDLVSNKHIKCTETGCKAFFSNVAHLSMHLAKHHRSQEISAQYEADTLKLYFCPINECTYSDKLKNGKYFTCLKYLRQHFQKVHMDKKYQCSMCPKRFATNGMKLTHELNCGQRFVCEECGWVYKSRGSLYLHARRKGHTASTVVASDDYTTETSGTDVEEKDNIIKDEDSCNLLSKLLLDTCTQTQDNSDTNSTPETSPVKPFVCNECGWTYNSREALLIHCRRKGHLSRITSIKVEKLVPKKRKSKCEATSVVFEESNNFESKSIQTEVNNGICVAFEMLNENLKREQDYNSDEDDSGKRFKLQQSTNSFEFASAASTSEKGTSITFDIYNNVLKEETETSFEQFVTSSSYCDIETQTEYPANLLETVLYSDTHTQTCDDLLSEFGFNDIQTQTNWPENNSVDCDTTTDVQDINDLLVSTETQTSFSQCLLNSTGVSAITQHTQTCDTLLDGLFGERQTDLIAEFQSTYTQT